MRVELDHWSANRCSEEVIEVDTSAEIMSIIDRLDRNCHTLINIIKDNNIFMIGGGPDNFIAVRQHSDGSSSSLSNGFSDQNKEKIYLCVGGQEGDYDSQIVLDRKMINSLIDDIVANRENDRKVWIPD